MAVLNIMEKIFRIHKIYLSSIYLCIWRTKQEEVTMIDVLYQLISRTPSFSPSVISIVNKYLLNTYYTYLVLGKLLEK